MKSKFQRLIFFYKPVSITVFSVFGIQSASAADKYWNGTGNNQASVWDTAAFWSSNSDGSSPSAGLYGGDRAVFSASNVTTAQTVQMRKNLTVASLKFASTNTAGAAILGGNGDYTLTLDAAGILIESGSGAVTIGSATAGQRVNLTQGQGNVSWTNNSSNLLTLHNNVSVSYENLTITGTGNITINGTLSGGGGSYASLSKTGNGILTLNGNNTYVMQTAVSSGALVVNGNQNAATSAVSISGSGTRLAGTGTVGGNTTINSGAIHSAGALGAVGKQTFDQAGSATTNLTYNTGSIFSWDIDRTKAQTRGVGYDAVDVSGTLFKSTSGNSPGGAIFRVVIGDNGFTNNFWSIQRTWSDIFASGTIQGSNGTTTSLQQIFSGAMQFYNTSGSLVNPSGQGSFSFTGNTLTWTPQSGAVFVPEPTSAVAGILLAVGAFRRRRSP